MLKSRVNGRVYSSRRRKHSAGDLEKCECFGKNDAQKVKEMRMVG